MFADWENMKFCKLIYARIPCKNSPNSIELSTFLIQKYLLSKFCSLKEPKLSQFMRFYWGKIWFEDFPPCKRFDILQLWIQKFGCPWKKLSDSCDDRDLRGNVVVSDY